MLGLERTWIGLWIRGVEDAGREIFQVKRGWKGPSTCTVNT